MEIEDSTDFAQLIDNVLKATPPEEQVMVLRNCLMEFADHGWMDEQLLNQVSQKIIKDYLNSWENDSTQGSDGS